MVYFNEERLNHEAQKAKTALSAVNYDITNVEYNKGV